MDIRSLKHAVAVAEAGSFVRAADKLALSQSAVSRSIQALEESLGVALFDRTPAGVYPTLSGQRLVENARRLVADAEALRREVMMAQSSMTGAVAFGAVPALASGYIPQLMVQVFREAPGLSHELKVRVRQELTDELRAENIEFFFAIGDERKVDGELQCRTLGCVGGGGIFVRPEHPLVNETDSIDQNKFLQYPIVVAGSDRFVARYSRGLLQGEGQRPVTFRLICENLHVLHRVVAKSDALMLTSQSAVAELVAEGDVVEIVVPRDGDIGENVDVEIVTLKGRTLSPAAELIVDRFTGLLN